MIECMHTFVGMLLRANKKASIPVGTLKNNT